MLKYDINLLINSLVFIMADLKLQLWDSLLHSDDVLLESCLLSLKLSQLLLESLTLSQLVRVVTLDFLLDSVKLIG